MCLSMRNSRAVDTNPWLTQDVREQRAEDPLGRKPVCEVTVQQVMCPFLLEQRKALSPYFPQAVGVGAFLLLSHDPGSQN